MSQFRKVVRITVVILLAAVAASATMAQVQWRNGETTYVGSMSRAELTEVTDENGKVEKMRFHDTRHTFARVAKKACSYAVPASSVGARLTLNSSRCTSFCRMRFVSVR